jgi:probable F420-dependent oxidoreductase
MKIDSVLRQRTVGETLGDISAAQAAGFDGLWTAETASDPFLPLVLAAEHSSTPDLGTSIAVAFARSPMTTAYTAYDLQRMSGGRFILGLGSQIRPHIERRFSMPWSHPARRMREYVLALRAIWTAWSDGTALKFDGEFYRHTLMTPFFAPAPQPGPAPQVFIAAVGPAMTEVAGEVCDGLLVHPFSTRRYLDERLIPALARGAERAGRPAAGIRLSQPCLIATGDETQLAAGRERVRERVAFYGSTPAYRGVLETHGWGDLGDRLHAESRARDDGRWARMARLVPDEVVDEFAVCGSTEDVAQRLVARFAGRVDRVTLTRPPEVGPEAWAQVIAAVKKAAN